MRRKLASANSPPRGGLAALLIAPVIALAGLSTPALRSQDDEPRKTSPDVDERIRALQNELDGIARELDRLQSEKATRADPAGQGDGEVPPERPDEDEPEAAVQWTPAWKRDPLEKPAALRGVYDKPFLAELWRRAFVGGYTEIEYHAFEDGVLGVPEGFRMHRTNLFLFTDLTDRLRFGSELEFETEFEGEGVSDEIELAVEMAFVDWKIYEEFVLRGGAIVAPLGRVNVQHDGPTRELTDRPLVSTFVIPTTLTEVGFGALGTVRVAEGVGLDYEAYAVNGFNLLDSDGELAVELSEREKLLREGRTSLGGDINGGLSGLGRLGLELDGDAGTLELGGSWHVGTYDEEGDNLLELYAGDLTFVSEIGGAEIGVEGEIAVADFERDAFARTAGVPADFWGYYVQLSVGGMPRVLRDAVPHVFDDSGSRFTAVVRWDWVDLDGDVGSAIEPGINFRPAADTVFKFSYKFTQKSLGLRGVPGRDFDDDGFVFSLSSYF